MKKENRILKNADFSTLIKTGKKYHTPSLCFYYLPNVNNSYRIGVTISKKVSKLAVVRNLIKRRIIAILIQQYNIKNLYDIIIVVKHGTDKINYQELESQVKQFINKL